MAHDSKGRSVVTHSCPSPQVGSLAGRSALTELRDSQGARAGWQTGPVLGVLSSSCDGAIRKGRAVRSGSAGK